MKFHPPLRIRHSPPVWRRLLWFSLVSAHAVDQNMGIGHGIGDAVAVAEKLRLHVAEPIRLDGRTIEATVSIGAVIAHGEESTESLVARADASLHEAKQHRRNQVITVEEAVAA